MLLNSALKIQCHIVKNTLRHTAFSAILLVYYARICFREKPVCLSVISGKNESTFDLADIVSKLCCENYAAPNILENLLCFI